MTETRARLDRSVSERDFQRTVIRMAHAYRWKVAHFRPARVTVDGVETYRTPVEADGKGFFDLVLVRPPHLIFVECKSEKGVLSAEQKEWGELLVACGTTVETYDEDDILEHEVWVPAVAYYVWRPSMLDEIEKILR